MLKLEPGRKARLRHHPIARSWQALSPASQREIRVVPAGLSSIWTARFGPCPVFGIHVSDFDPK